jgi:hypothetical protein
MNPLNKSHDLTDPDPSHCSPDSNILFPQTATVVGGIHDDKSNVHVSGLHLNVPPVKLSKSVHERFIETVASHSSLPLITPSPQLGVVTMVFGTQFEVSNWHVDASHFNEPELNPNSWHPTFGNVDTLPQLLPSHCSSGKLFILPSPQ